MDGAAQQVSVSGQRVQRVKVSFSCAAGGPIRRTANVCHVWLCKQLGTWMAARLDEHALFRRLSATEAAADVAAGMLTSATEEGIKVARNSGQVRIQEALSLFEMNMFATGR